MQARIVWGAMMASVGIVGAVGFMAPELAAGVATEQVPLWTFVSVFGAVSTLILFVVALGGRWLATKFPHYTTYCIIRWALCESIAIYGLVLVFFGLDPLYMLAFSVTAWTALLLCAPNDVDHEQWAQAQQGS